MRTHIKVFSTLFVFLSVTSTESLAKLQESIAEERIETLNIHSTTLQLMPDEKNTPESLFNQKKDETITDETLINNPLKTALSIPLTDETPGNSLLDAVLPISATDEAAENNLSGATSYLFWVGEYGRNLGNNLRTAYSEAWTPENESVIRNGIASCASHLLLNTLGIPGVSPILIGGVSIAVRNIFTDPAIDYVFVPVVTTVRSYWVINSPETAAVA